MGAPQHIICNYEMKVTTLNHFSSNPSFTHRITKKVVKPQHAVAAQIKQGQLTTTSNPQYATKNESLQLQVTKCPIYG
jgi:hypothetical protein